MSVIVTDEGFQPEDWTGGFVPLEELLTSQEQHSAELAVDFPNDQDPAVLQPWLDRLALIRVGFPAMTDGRGFSIGTRLRRMGYAGRLRAAGPLIADQYPAARRTGFDEVEIPDALAERQPESAWRELNRPDYRTKFNRG